MWHKIHFSPSQPQPMLWWFLPSPPPLKLSPEVGGLTFTTTLCSLDAAGTNHVTLISATIPIQASATANPPHVHTGHCSSQPVMSSRHPPASVNHTLVSGHDPAAHTPSTQAACQPLLLGINCKVSRFGKTPVKSKEKSFP